MLDALRGAAALPHADQPHARHAPAGEAVEFFIRDLVEPADVTPVGLRQLVEPHKGALRQQHHARHPVAIRRETLGFVLGATRTAKTQDRVRARITQAAPIGGVHAHPPRLGFLGQHIESGQQAHEQVAEQVAPVAANVFQLRGQRLRVLARRGAQHIDEELVIGAVTRAAYHPALECGEHVGAGGARGERAVVEQFAERGDGGILVGEPQHQQFFQRECPVRHSGGGFGQPGGSAVGAVMHRDRWEFPEESRERLVDPLRTELAIDRIKRQDHGARVALLLVLGDDEVEHLVHQPHGIEVAGIERRLGRGRLGAPVVDAQGERAHGGEIGEHDVTAEREQRIGKPIALTRRAGDMEFEQGKRQALGHGGRIAPSSPVRRGSSGVVLDLGRGTPEIVDSARVSADIEG